MDSSDSAIDPLSGEADPQRTGAHPDEQVSVLREISFGTIIEVSGNTAIARVDYASQGEVMGEKDGKVFSVGQIGTTVKMRVGNANIYGVVRRVWNNVSAAGTEGHQHMDLDFIAQSDIDPDTGKLKRTSRGVSSYPVPGCRVLTTTAADLSAIFAPPGAHIAIGAIYPTYEVPATLNIDSFLSRHFAILGSTGTGKSCAVALLVHHMVQSLPNGHVLILDPHNEYATAFRQQGVHYDTQNLSLPYWMMNLEEHIQVFIGPRTSDKEVDADVLKRCLIAARRKGPVSKDFMRITVDTPVPYRLADLLQEIDSNMGRLEKPETLLPFLRLKNKIEELKNDIRYNFMFSGLLVGDTLTETVSRLLRFPAQGRPVTTLDLSGVPSDIVDVVVSVLCRLVFDFAIWSHKLETRRPLLLICEEAHRYVPGEDGGGQTQQARIALERIAKEGRKYGVSLGLVTQRPSELSESVLSQCGTILSMRMNNEKDRRFVERAMPEGSRGFLDSIPALGKQECILSGEGVNAPVRVRLSDLDADLRPSSDDPDFSNAWLYDVNDPEYTGRVIRHWREQRR